MATPILRVAVPSPLRRTFDYLAPASGVPEVGARVRVPFGRRRLVGMVLAVGVEPTVPRDRLRPVIDVLDTEPLLAPEATRLLAWTAAYYHHPPGEVLATALPGPLREGRPARAPANRQWRLSESGSTPDPASLRRAPKQAELLEKLRAQPTGLSEADGALDPAWRPVLRRMVEKGWVEEREVPCIAARGAGSDSAPELNAAQHEAVQAVAAAAGRFGVFLVDGVTGSGKTEVYLGAIEEVIGRGRQALVLVPEIGLTPQLTGRFRRRFDVPVAVLHSGLSDGERLCAWTMARSGEAPIVIGTRSAVFVPLARPGLIVVDEEHDSSFKQHEGLRYSARDVAIKRAQDDDVPVVLGSATPSLESLHNAERGRYRRLLLPERAGAATHPTMRLLDIRSRPLHEGMADTLLGAAERHLGAGGQVLLFLNRRGFAPTLLCHDCGWVAECERCDAHLTFHRGRGRLRCHHCGTDRPVPASCGSCGSVDLRAVGLGTERVETVLEARFPDVPVVRIDRDSTRRKGAMDALLEKVRGSEPMILVGTQMIAKGHHLPGVTLVGVLDADQGLFSADFRAGERMAQLIVQVAGRAGRAEKPGEVLIQTHHPEHPLLRQLVEHGYHAFAELARDERQLAELPPFAHLALLRAEAVDASRPQAFLEEAYALAERVGVAEVELEGPVPAPMERRAGRYRAQLMLRAPSRATLHRLLSAWVPLLENAKTGRRVRWSLDVDPVETY